MPTSAKYVSTSIVLNLQGGADSSGSTQEQVHMLSGELKVREAVKEESISNHIQTDSIII